MKTICNKSPCITYILVLVHDQLLLRSSLNYSAQGQVTRINTTIVCEQKPTLQNDQR